MTDWWIGTMGFGYQDWRGGFYPQELAARNYLSYYSRIFNAAEVDSTFYGTPRASTVRRWAAQTPAEFRFCLKTPRTITHELGLVNAQGLMAEFVQAAGLLGPKLGAILLQFPPSFTASQLDTLAAFLGQLPAGPRYAVELRDASWYAPELGLATVLQEAGVAWASTEYPGLPDRIDLTAPSCISAGSASTAVSSITPTSAWTAPASCRAGWSASSRWATGWKRCSASLITIIQASRRPRPTDLRRCWVWRPSRSSRPSNRGCFECVSAGSLSGASVLCERNRRLVSPATRSSFEYVRWGKERPISLHSGCLQLGRLG